MITWSLRKIIKYDSLEAVIYCIIFSFYHLNIIYVIFTTF